MSKTIDPEVLAKYSGDTPSRNNPYNPWDIDCIHATSKIHCVPETAAYLYGGYTPRKITYTTGSRPELEFHLEVALKNCRARKDRAPILTSYVNRVVLHTMYVPKHLHELGGTEEHVLRRGFGYCNEMARVLCAMAQISGIPTRLLFVRLPSGSRHVMVEMLTDGKWGFFDPSFNLYLPVGKAYAGALDIQKSKQLRARLDKLASVNEKYLHTLGRRGDLYSGYFHRFAVLNYPLTDFPFGVTRPR
jgi:hypothetical protein